MCWIFWDLNISGTLFVNLFPWLYTSLSRTDLFPKKISWFFSFTLKNNLPSKFLKADSVLLFKPHGVSMHFLTSKVVEEYLQNLEHPHEKCFCPKIFDPNRLE